jgi:hypothetical protein
MDIWRVIKKMAHFAYFGPMSWHGSKPFLTPRTAAHRQVWWDCIYPVVINNIHESLHDIHTVSIFPHRTGTVLIYEIKSTVYPTQTGIIPLKR